MLLSALILVSIDGEHNRLKQRIDLRHGNQSTEMRDVPRLGLQEEQKVAIFLGLIIVGEYALLQVGRVLEVAGDFVLLLCE